MAAAGITELAKAGVSTDDILHGGQIGSLNLAAAGEISVADAATIWLGCVDLAWTEAKLIVEYEGAYHFDGVQIDKDDERYRRLIAAGWRVIRLLANDLRDMAAVVQRIREALAIPTAEV